MSVLTSRSSIVYNNNKLLCGSVLWRRVYNRCFAVHGFIIAAGNGGGVFYQAVLLFARKTDLIFATFIYTRSKTKEPK